MCCGLVVISCGNDQYSMHLFKSPNTNTQLYVCGSAAPSETPGCSTASVCTHQPAFIRPVRTAVLTEAQWPGVPAPSWPCHPL